ncbi:peptidase S16 [Kosmotoga arenicorallina S304]|uniref:endopeptidase La n=1 Tax=Kosmotoga arenicorallina S304 TaxID=1453497 RepID=A0A176K063_9BACT|nr:ATP-binding protein [Kosmotoga arenicorallina]OAA29926.1 peptidase S16 [Kosmotoga arenicorallina S304]
MKKISWQELKLNINLPRSIDRASSLPELEEFIGQERALEALEIGIRMNKLGFNIFVSGLTNTGRRTFVRKFLAGKIKDGSTSKDWLYVYNFNDPRSPNVISTPAGLGGKLKKDLENFVEIMVTSVKEAFQSDDYQKKVNALQTENNERKNSLLKELVDRAREEQYLVQINQAGVATIPLWNEKPLTQEVYDALPEEYRREIEKHGEKVRELVNSYILELRKLERDYGDKLKELNRQVATFAIEGHLSELKKKYRTNKEVVDFLERLKKDILDNLAYFFNENSDAMIFFKKRYAVNLFVDNSKSTGRPIVEEMNATYSNLFGRIEYVAKMGMLDTDHTMIRAGAVHRANGGYLILDAKNVLSEPYVWNTLKRVLFDGNLRIENLEHRLGLVSTVSLKPEPIPIDFKVILIGEPWIYQLLTAYDPDFKKLFKIKAEFDWEMDFNSESAKKFCRFVHSIASESTLLDFDRTALKEIIKKAILLSGNRKKLSIRFGTLKQLLEESSELAKIKGAPIVSGKHIEEAWNGMRKRVSLYKDKIEEEFRNSILYVETSGKAVGEVNGLTVIETEDLSFGIPVKITAKVSPGNEGIVDIQREAGLSGKIHTKASLIVQGYLHARYAQHHPLSLNAFVSFEQVYSMVEGDSASVAEVAALLSAISGIPLKQSIAVTGSINQSGRVQPVGGIPQKIEGFFRLCEIKGLNGEQGVIIPQSNLDNLVLSDEVTAAVKKGLFHIWAVESVDEALELLSGKKAGVVDKTGHYPVATFNRVVCDKLEHFYKISLSASEEKRKKK